MSKALRNVALGALAATILVSTGGCTKVRTHQGFVADVQLIESIQPGVDNRDSVARTLGRPSFISEFDERAWYYVARDMRQFGFGRPEPKHQVLLVVAFDKNGTVSAVDRRGLEKVVSIDMVRDKTPTLGRETGLIEDLFGNIGRVGSLPGSSGPGGGGPNGGN